MKKILFAIFLISLLSISSSTILAQDIGEEVTIYLGELQPFPASKPLRIAIGKPEIADVVSVSEKEIILAAKSVGTTTFVFWDNFGERSYQIIVAGENMNLIKNRIDNLLSKLNLPDVHTKAEDQEGKVMLLGKVKTAQDREKISIALGALKDKTVDLIEVKEEETVIEIDVQVLELNKDATDTLGFTMPGAINLLEVGSAGITSAGSSLGGLFRIHKLERATYSAGTTTTDPFVFKLDALIQEGKARVLSRPRLACQSGKEAELLVGGEKPIFTTTVAATTGAAGTQVEYKEFGIKLKIKPTVTEEKRIKLGLNVEVSEVGTAEFIGLTTQRTAQAYPLTKRNASTELSLDNGQTMAIGGLIKQKTEEEIRKTPWLGDVPLFGAFFRKKTTRIGGGTGERGNTELFITLTPTIISKEMPLEKMPASSEKITLKEEKVEEKEVKKEEPPIKLVRVPANLSNYIRAVQAKILSAAYYPQQAKDAGWEGNVKLSLNINSNGELKDIKISQSSGYKVLDDAALQVAQTQAPYPPFPPQIESQELWVDVPIIYKKN